MTEIRAHFTLTGDDYEAYLRYFYQHTRTGRRHMRRLYALGVALFLLFVGLEYDHPKFGIAHPGYFAVYLTISAIMLGGGYWFCIKRLWPSIAQSAVRMSPQKGMFQETWVTLTEEGLQVRTAEGEGKLAWDSVQQVADGPNGIYLFMGGVNAFILPRRSFEDAALADEALALIRARTKGRENS